MWYGFRDGEDKWKFTGGQGVADTLDGYNRYAQKENLSQADFLAVCNEDTTTMQTGIFVGEHNIPRNIAYAAGSTVHVQGIVERLYVQSDENIFDLDELKASKEIVWID